MNFSPETKSLNTGGYWHGLFVAHSRLKMGLDKKYNIEIASTQLAACVFSNKA